MFKNSYHVNAYQNIVDKTTWTRNYFKHKIDARNPNIILFKMRKKFSMHNSREDIFNISYFWKKKKFYRFHIEVISQILSHFKDDILYFSTFILNTMSTT
jgi:hypothetical protein